jgi:hypothetical protein
LSGGGELGDLDLAERHGGVRVAHRVHVETADLGWFRVLRRRLLRSIQKLRAIDDLQNAALVDAIREIEPVAVLPVETAPWSPLGSTGRRAAGRQASREFSPAVGSLRSNSSAAPDMLC